jgi:hypothetical protein
VRADWGVMRAFVTAPSAVAIDSQTTFPDGMRRLSRMTIYALSIVGALFRYMRRWNISLQSGELGKRWKHAAQRLASDPAGIGNDASHARMRGSREQAPMALLLRTAPRSKARLLALMRERNHQRVAELPKT